jgi:hypothetical protein
MLFSKADHCRTLVRRVSSVDAEGGELWQDGNRVLKMVINYPAHPQTAKKPGGVNSCETARSAVLGDIRRITQYFSEKSPFCAWEFLHRCHDYILSLA